MPRSLLAARPRALWPWINGNTDLAELTHELEEAKAKGMGGFDMDLPNAKYGLLPSGLLGPVEIRFE